MVRYDINIYMKTAVRNIVDPPRINLVANDYNGNRFDFTVFHDNRTIFDLTGKRVTLITKSPSGAVVQDFCEITSATEGKATITLKTSMFQEAGEYYVELQVYDDNSRATSAPFNYTVRRALDGNEIVVTSNEFSVLQEALENVREADATADEALVVANTAKSTSDQALTTANSAKNVADTLFPKVEQAATTAATAKSTADEAKSVADAVFPKVTQATNESSTALQNSTVAKTNSETALSTANNAKAIADDLVPKVTQAATDANEALDRALSVVTQDDLAEKVTIDDEFVSNVNFIRNDLTSGAMDIASQIRVKSTYTLQFKVTLESINSSTVVFISNRQSTTKGFSIVSSNAKLQIRTYGASGSSITDILLNAEVNKTYDITIFSYDGKLYVNNGKDTIAIDTTNFDDYTGAFVIDNTSTTKSRNVVVSNRILTLQEIQHNFNVLSNSQSISKINDYVIASDTDHITDSSSILQSKINRVFYKNMCKEFTSSGTDIVVNNGMDGYVLSGMITGQTIKNIAKSTNKLTFQTGLDVSKTLVSSFVMSTLKANTTYTLIYKIVGNATTNTRLTPVLSTVSGNVIQLDAINKNNTEGIKVWNYTPIADVSLISVLFWGHTPSSDISVECLGFLEGNYSANDFKISIPAGLSSTQAVVYNNQMKYSFYKDSVDKASGAVITLGGVGGVYDTLEIKEDGSGVLTQKTNTTILNGSEYYSLTGTQLNNTVTVLSSFIKPMNANSGTNRLLNDKLQTIQQNDYAILDSNCMGSINLLSNFFIRLSKSLLSTPDVSGIKTWLQANPITVRYQLDTPIITTIPKELVPTILTQATNEFKFGDAVMATKATVSVPVNRIADFETRIAQLENVITSTSNLAILGNYAEDEYNKEINKL